MSRQKMLTQSYVMTEDGRGYRLEYYLDSYLPKDSNSTQCGITIKMLDDETLVNFSSTGFLLDEDTACKYIDLFAHNFLFPCSLVDVVEDMIAG